MGKEVCLGSGVFSSLFFSEDPTEPLTSSYLFADPVDRQLDDVLAVVREGFNSCVTIQLPRSWSVEYMRGRHHCWLRFWDKVPVRGRVERVVASLLLWIISSSFRRADGESWRPRPIGAEVRTGSSVFSLLPDKDVSLSHDIFLTVGTVDWAAGRVSPFKSKSSFSIIIIGFNGGMGFSSPLMSSSSMIFSLWMPFSSLSLWCPFDSHPCCHCGQSHSGLMYFLKENFFSHSLWARYHLGSSFRSKLQLWWT